MPKSAMRSVPCSSNMRFDGLTSRCTMPRSWMSASPAAASEPISPHALRPHRAAGEELEHARAVEQLHHEEGAPVVVAVVVAAGVEEAHEVRVVERGEGAHLHLEPGPVLDLPEDLDRDVPVEAQVAGAVDVGHAAPPDQLVEAVPAFEDGGKAGHAREGSPVAGRRTVGLLGAGRPRAGLPPGLPEPVPDAANGLDQRRRTPRRAWPGAAARGRRPCGRPRSTRSPTPARGAAPG